MTRRLLRLALPAGLGALALTVSTAGSAAADNCSVFTDCFNQANSAGEAAFGLAVLAGLSIFLDFTPVVGDVKGLVEGAIGRDLFTGQRLEPWERALGLAVFLPAADAARVAGKLDGLADLARGADNLPPPRLLGMGDSILLSDGMRRMQDAYLDPAATRSTRIGLSEQLGEAGAARYVQDVTGRPDLPVVRPTTDADVAGYADMVDRGEAWPQAVSFRGSRATNLVYFDGQTLHVVEAKGGSATYGDRVSRLSPGQRIGQTHPDYPLDVAQDMRTSRLADGRNEIGEAIRVGYRIESVRYVGVRTGTGADLHLGQASTRLERVFHDVPPAP